MNNVTINDIFYVLLTVALPITLRYVFQLISAKVADSKYSQTVNAILAAVEYVNQTFVDSLKASGSFDEEAQRKAFEMAKEAALASLSAGTYKWLERSFVDLDAWLTVQIESAVKAVKTEVYYENADSQKERIGFADC